MSTDNDIYECECWDPRNKWETQDVFNHMEEALDLMFQCFKVNPEEQQYQLDVGRKVIKFSSQTGNQEISHGQFYKRGSC